MSAQWPKKSRWLCVIDDALEILPRQTPKYGVEYSCSHVLFACTFTRGYVRHCGAGLQREIASGSRMFGVVSSNARRKKSYQNLSCCSCVVFTWVGTNPSNRRDPFDNGTPPIHTLSFTATVKPLNSEDVWSSALATISVLHCHAPRRFSDFNGALPTRRGVVGSVGSGNSSRKRKPSSIPRPASANSCTSSSVRPRPCLEAMAESSATVGTPIALRFAIARSDLLFQELGDRPRRRLIDETAERTRRSSPSSLHADLHRRSRPGRGEIGVSRSKAWLSSRASNPAPFGSIQ